MYDIIVSTLNDGTAGVTATKGLWNLPVNSAAPPVTVAGITFPTTATASSTAERPWWRDYWASVYQYYTVLGCQWKLTIYPSGNNRTADMMVYYQYDSYTDTAASAGNVMPQGGIAEVMSYRHVNWALVKSNNTEEDDQKSTTIMDDIHKPGDTQRNIVNDVDVKTWTAASPIAASGQIPNLKDILTVGFYKAPLSFANSNQIGANCQLEMKFLVQWKDLRQQARYPSGLGSVTDDIAQSINNNAGDDVRQIL